MSNILDAANALLDLRTEFTISLGTSFPQLDYVKKIVNDLEHRTSGNVGVPTKYDLNELMNIVQMIYDQYGNLSNLPYKESINLPFILNKITNDNLLECVLDEIRDNASIAILKREIYVYFNDYCGSYYVLQIEKDISKKLEKFKGKNIYLNLLKKNKYLFSSDGKAQVLQKCIECGFFKYFMGLKIPTNLLVSKYVIDILCRLYKDTSINFPLEKQWNLFNIIYNNDNAARIFASVIPIMIGRLIITVDGCNRSDKSVLKEKLRIIALKELGEPRIQRSSNSRWLIAGEEAKSIFIRWISQFDLDLFFKIINDSIPDYKWNDRKMWLAREKFWKSYKNNITMVWVCFGYAARRRVRNEEIYYGSFYGNGDDNKSCIIIEIGDFVFVERSHNGKVKVWYKTRCPFVIGISQVTESAITGSTCVAEWVHTPNSWQNKVGNFIQKNCGIPMPTQLWW